MKFNTFPGGFYLKVGTRHTYVSFMKSRHSVSIVDSIAYRLYATIRYTRRDK